MTDLRQPNSNTDPDLQTLPLRRPGWGMIHDVRPNPLPRKVVLALPEPQPRPITRPITRPTPQTALSYNSRKQAAFLWAKQHTLIGIAPLVLISSIVLSAVPVVGEILIIAYGIVALIKHIPSQTTFWLATIILTGIGLEFLLLPQVGQVDNSALFVFLLLIIGLISVTFETRKSERQEKAKRVDNTTIQLPAKTQG